MNLDLRLRPYIKIDLKQMMDLNVKHWEMKRQATEFEKRLANHTPGKG